MRFAAIALPFGGKSKMLVDGALLAISILLGCGLCGCGHALTNPEVVSSASPSAQERSVVVRALQIAFADSNHPAGDSYLYVSGYGRLPEGSTGQPQDWLRAKRAAIDDAYAKLLSEAVKKVGSQPARRAQAAPALRDDASRRTIGGTVEQAEILSVSRMPDGGCQVLMRAPLSQIEIIPEIMVTPSESRK